MISAGMVERGGDRKRNRERPPGAQSTDQASRRKTVSFRRVYRLPRRVDAALFRGCS